MGSCMRGIHCTQRHAVYRTGVLYLGSMVNETHVARVVLADLAGALTDGIKTLGQGVSWFLTHIPEILFGVVAFIVVVAALRFLLPMLFQRLSNTCQKHV